MYLQHANSTPFAYEKGKGRQGDLFSPIDIGKLLNEQRAKYLKKTKVFCTYFKKNRIEIRYTILLDMIDSQLFCKPTPKNEKLLASLTKEGILIKNGVLELHFYDNVIITNDKIIIQKNFQDVLTIKAITKESAFDWLVKNDAKLHKKIMNLFIKNSEHLKHLNLNYE